MLRNLLIENEEKKKMREKFANLVVFEEFDYLILSYSGGSDTHNILESFMGYFIRMFR